MRNPGRSAWKDAFVSQTLHKMYVIDTGHLRCKEPFPFDAFGLIFDYNLQC